MNKVCVLREQNPCMSLIEIANTVGISKQRVSKILMANNLPTCSTNRIGLITSNCLYCGKEFIRFLYSKEKVKGILPTYCSRRCSSMHCRVTLICDHCGKVYDVPQSNIIANYKRYNPKHFFYSRECCKKYKSTHKGEVK